MRCKESTSLKKGANACRNYGFTKTIATTIKWFDSDDIMLPDHLEIAYKTLIEKDLDFVVTDTMNFDHDTHALLGRPYNFNRNKESVTAENLAYIRIGWITDDFLGTRKIVESVKFNENITDGDEYNYFIKILHNKFKGEFLNQTLTHRRMHIDSISFKNKQNDLNYMSILATLKYQTANDLVVYDNKALIRWFLSGYMRISFDLALSQLVIPYKKDAFILICKYHSFLKATAFSVALFLGSHFKKGYNIMKYARK